MICVGFRKEGGLARLGRTNNCPADTFVRANVKEEASGSFSSPPPKESTNDLCEPPPTCPSTYLYQRWQIRMVRGCEKFLPAVA